MFNAETVVHLIGDPCLKLYHKGKFDDHGLVVTKISWVGRYQDGAGETAQRPAARNMGERGQDIRRRDAGAARAVTSDGTDQPTTGHHFGQHHTRTAVPLTSA